MDEMSDDDRPMSASADVVSERRFEPAVAEILRGPAGRWVPVAAACAGIDAAVDLGDVAAAWLPDPSGDPGYAIILFFDPTSGGSMTAHYDRDRLLRAVGP